MDTARSAEKTKDDFGRLYCIEQLLGVPGVTRTFFYGTAPDFGYGETAKPDLDARSTPLFRLLSVYGGGVPQEAADDFKDGATYRIISTGRVTRRSPAQTIYLVVRKTTSSAMGYEVLYRTIL